MYAQCPECMTFFRVTSDQLRAAEGKVRCSKCQNVFNAVTTLRETLSEAELEAAREEQGAVQALAPGSNLPINDLFETPEDFEQNITFEVPGYEHDTDFGETFSEMDSDDALDAFLVKPGLRFRRPLASQFERDLTVRSMVAKCHFLR